MNSLDTNGLRLLEFLTARLKKAHAGDPTTYVTYKETHEALGIELNGPRYGQSLQRQGLNSLAQWIYENNLPAITGLIISKKDRLPGLGYFALYDVPSTAIHWWHDEIDTAKHFDWSILEFENDDQHHDSGTSIPGRATSVINRIIRDTPAARYIKKIHQFECQICGKILSLPDGKRYAEAHHIRPLGGEHCGNDDTKNLICVCPNHHAILDKFALYLSLDTILKSDIHNISIENLEYHNVQYNKHWKV